MSNRIAATLCFLALATFVNAIDSANAVVLAQESGRAKELFSDSNFERGFHVVDNCRNPISLGDLKLPFLGETPVEEKPVWGLAAHASRYNVVDADIVADAKSAKAETPGQIVSRSKDDQGVVTNGLVSAVANVQVANYAQSGAVESDGGDGGAGGGVANSVVQAVSNSSSAGGYSSGLSSAVDRAYSVIGTQYTYGGMSVETGFDCSGLVNYAYGGDRGRSTGDMISSLQGSGDWKTSLDDLQYGDLVFPSAGHVGIYIGNGQMIHSPVPGQSVEVSNVYSFYGGGSY